MRPETQSRLDEIFEQSEQQDIAVARAKSERDRTEEAALAKFKTLREELIKPTMQSFAHYLASKGHNANVVENEERFEGGPTGARLMEEASIELRISPQGADQYAQYTKGPHFLVSLDTDRRNPRCVFMNAQRGDSTAVVPGHAGSLVWAV